MFNQKLAALLAAGLSLTLAGAAQAGKIHTGGARGAYNSDFCPPLAEQLKKARFNYKCTLSTGSKENMQRVRNNPTDIGLAQFDIFALRAAENYGKQPYHIIRGDIARECVFMVTKNKKLENFGDVAARADELSFVLPPEGSGSAATFEYLRSIDPSGLGRASKVSHAESTDLALKRVLQSDDTSVALFVQFPDPDNDRFKMIAKEKGLFVPVIDRNILRQQIGGQKVYFAQETEVANAKFWKKGTKVTTACTPMVVFTGNPDLIAAGQKQLDQKDIINTINDIPAKQLLPKKSFFKTYWSKTKSLSADTAEKIMTASEKAREKAAPLLESAKEKAIELGNKASEKTQELREKAAPMLETAKEKAKEYGEKAYDKAKELGDAAKEKMNQQ